MCFDPNIVRQTDRVQQLVLMLRVSGGHPSSSVTVGNEDAAGGWGAGGYSVRVCVLSMHVKRQREGHARFHTSLKKTRREGQSQTV